MESLQTISMECVSEPETTIGVKEVHLITNGFDRDVKMAEEISNFYCSTTLEII